MVLLFVAYFFIGALILGGFYRSLEVKFLGALMASLAIYMLTVLTYFAKKGGMSPELSLFYFGTRTIRNWLQYLNITLHQLGFTMAVSRIVFPFLLIRTAISYSLEPWIRKHAYWSRYVYILAGVLVLLYLPPIFRLLAAYNKGILTALLVVANMTLLIITILSMGIIVKELVSIELAYYRKQFMLLSIFLLGLSLTYMLYLMQDPSQVYHFYDANFFWQLGIFYLYSLPIRWYLILLLLTIVASAVATISITKYSHNVFARDDQERQIRQRKQIVSPVVTMFIHSMKNQFLTQQILLKRLEKVLADPQPDLNKVHAYLAQLKEDTDQSLDRMNRLYRSLKDTQVRLVPMRASDLIYGAIDRALGQYPDIPLQVQVMANPLLLADRDLLCEAMANVIINAYEANQLQADPSLQVVTIKLRQVRAFSLFEISDQGPGIIEADRKKLFTPFYSSKNSKSNWGMGLYFVQEVVKGHFGGVDVSSSLGQGATFTIFIPKFKE